MDKTRASFSFGVFLSCVLLLVGCGFSDPPSGKLKCAQGSQACPGGYVCDPGSLTCWKASEVKDDASISDTPVAQDGPASVDGDADLNADSQGDGAVDEGSTCQAGAPCDFGRECKKGRVNCATGVPVCEAGGDADDGSPCGSGKVCAAGQCVECSAGSKCVPSNPCHNGALACEGGTPSCVDLGTSRADGDSCGTDKVCRAGVCADCRLDASCEVAGAACRVGKTSCNTGQPVCIETGNAPDGSKCGNGMVCSGGACKACSQGTSCVPANPCHAGTLDCSSGTPTCAEGTTAVGNGTKCGDNKVCLNGTCAACAENQDCVPPGTTCKVGKTSCTTGTSVCVLSANAADGSDCGSGRVCSSGSCVACANGATCTPAGAPCHKGALDCSSGLPECKDQGTYQPNGTGCGTDLVCNNGSCAVCRAGTVCTPDDNVCKTGQTECTTGASVCKATGNVPDSPRVSCGPGMSCSAGTCAINPGCGSAAALDCPCAGAGSLNCNGARQALKLKCTGGVWVDNGTCLTGQNCDQSDGQCHTMISRCQTSAVFCDASDTLQTCNADYTATTPTPCVGICSANACQPPVCGDGKEQPSLAEECDDGNLTPGDGCEANCKTSTVVGLSAGDNFTCALLGSGAVRCWGDNTYGQLGLTDRDPHNTVYPYQIGLVTFGTETATQIASGSSHTCVALSGGGVRCWGANDWGQLGQGDTTVRNGPAPTISFSSPVKALVAGGSETCAVLENGSVRCWGANGSGALGLATTEHVSRTQAATALGAVSIGGTASSVVVGAGFVCATLATGSPICWGNNDLGQLGRGDTTSIGATETPAAATPPATPILPTSRTTNLMASGASHTCARLDNGYLECWGSNLAGQLGLGLAASGTSMYIGDDEAPATSGVLVLTDVSKVFAGNASTCAKLVTGALRCWGLNTKSQLGYGDITNRGGTSATRPASLPDVSFGSGITATTVALGASHSCALLSNGEVRCWGRNHLGQLGDGTRLLVSPDYVAKTPDQLTGVRVFQ